MKETFLVDENELEDLAEDVIKTLSKHEGENAKLLLLEGDLGAGKTTFTKTLGKMLGIPYDDIHSPTFILKKEYTTNHNVFKKMIHIDAYRFEDPSEAEILKLEDDLISPANLIVIEWPSKMGYADGDMTLSFNHQGDTTRNITIDYTAHDTKL
ncbi:MAG: tRNA (adenosine(37)-N6)-threonylcarbamoyltransferase complex ATPase subunit type 1 TsaE [Candidatus Pacebacteria bacterium]|nr:tRNA (adenosine(37)-N6)-threonylcarbamoyltransferase complex ATPase subunit type 1 TsaE [Candidatus Paceibacterota bacterium]